MRNGSGAPGRKLESQASVGGRPAMGEKEDGGVWKAVICGRGGQCSNPGQAGNAGRRGGGTAWGKSGGGGFSAAKEDP